MKKLELKNLKVKQLTKNEQENTKGGLFLSIGHACSVENNCSRVQTEPTTGSPVLSFVC
ncbi:hypothetical protein KU06112801_60012 [Flavobacterium psychrophilum]|uniref:hypothetical protein n=1 Tax=Flavobacterium psychrophilum TaxID=96345 RepID=UPI000B7C4AC4|nr:hypothetical protein [Flavobacterium psychrophilum]SNB17885.1 hypothetical protein KU06112801_60012 [Flavobacterium psychrophilum]